MKNSKVPLFSDLPEVHKPVGERARSPGGSSQASNSIHSESDFRAFLDDQAIIHFLIYKKNVKMYGGEEGGGANGYCM